MESNFDDDDSAALSLLVDNKRYMHTGELCRLDQDPIRVHNTNENYEVS